MCKQSRACVKDTLSMRTGSLFGKVSWWQADEEGANLSTLSPQAHDYSLPLVRFHELMKLRVRPHENKFALSYQSLTSLNQEKPRGNEKEKYPVSINELTKNAYPWDSRHGKVQSVKKNFRCAILTNVNV